MRWTYEKQLEINAILRDLVEIDGSTFDCGEAKALRNSLPAFSPKRFVFEIRMPKLFGSSEIEGVTNTGDRASLDEGEKSTVITNEPVKQWVGRYALRREDRGNASDILIEERFEYTREEKTKSWWLTFSKGEPIALRVASPKSWRFAGWRLTYYTFPIWKVPA